MAPQDVVHSGSERYLCRPYGGCARPLCRRGRSQASGGLLSTKVLHNTVAGLVKCASQSQRRSVSPMRYDCEYKRNGTANLFVFLDAHKPWRHVKVTDHRTARDFAECMRDQADKISITPDADRIPRGDGQPFLTHKAGGLAMRNLPRRPEAHRVLQRPGISLYAETCELAQLWWKSRSAYCAVNVWIARIG